MATLTLKGTNRTLWGSNVPSEKAPAGENPGKVHWLYDDYSWATDSVIADVVTLMQIPKGARIVDAVVKANDHGSAGQYDIGYAASAELDSAGSAVEAADDDALFNEFNPEGTGGNVASLGGGGLLGGTGIGAVNTAGAALFKSFSAAVNVTITVTEASNVGTGVNIKLGVAYVID